jgi:hypothetical protein
VDVLPLSGPSILIPRSSNGIALHRDSFITLECCGMWSLFILFFDLIRNVVAFHSIL